MSAGKVIFVVTNHSKLGETSTKTGWYLPEVAHPYEVLTKKGYQITFVSPKGGKAPMALPGFFRVLTSIHCKRLAVFPHDHNKIAINYKDYKALFYAGGHGPMFDLPSANEIASLATKIYEAGGILAAVCHGTVGFVPVKLSTGDSLVKDQTVTSFTNAEEDAVNLSSQMPLMLETKLKDLGAKFVGADNWACNVQISGRLVTGQNPASATKVAEEMLKIM